MTENEFLDRIDALLSDLEDRLGNGSADIDARRSGNVLTLEFEDGSKVVINSQPAMQELWMAARSGGFHYRLIDGAWRDSRDGSDFHATLSAIVLAHGGDAL